MARLYATFGTAHDGSFSLLADPSIPLREQKDDLKDLRATKQHPEFSEVQVFELVPIIRGRFQPADGASEASAPASGIAASPAASRRIRLRVKGK